MIDCFVRPAITVIWATKYFVILSEAKNLARI